MISDDLLRRAARYPRGLGRRLRNSIRRAEAASMSFEQKVIAGVAERPAYAFCIYYGALLATRLGYSRISALEFGVAGGNGLVALESCAREIKRELGVDVQIYGFDSGAGLPEPKDYRDIPYLWRRGFYPMDLEKLRARLNTAQLVLGDISETAKCFFEKYQPAPIGAAFFDLDFYSSTVHAMRLFDADDRHFLPRVYCYFDDTTSDGLGAFCDYTGERLAICEFNDAHQHRKFAEIRLYVQNELWQRRLWTYHSFLHPEYNRFVLDQFLTMPLQS
jgi:hypothetical protein